MRSIEDQRKTGIMAEIDLIHPIRLHGVHTAELRLERLTPHKLEGLTLEHLLHMDVKAITKLLTVIARPRLRRSDINRLASNDFTQCAMAISNALLEGTAVMKSARAEVDAEQESDRG